MNIYTKRSYNAGKWIIGLIVFILAMTITFSDVHSVNIPPTGKTTQTNNTSDDIQSPPANQVDTDNGDQPITSVPEPTTLILLASGLGVIHLVNRRRKK